MPFNPKQFLSKIDAYNGISRPTHFEFSIVIPAFLAKNGYTSEHLTFTATSVNIPRVNLEDVSLRRTTVSYQETFPMNITFGDLSVTFLSDAKANNLSLFKEWLNYIFPTDANSESIFRIPYKNDYAVTATVNHFDPAGNKIVEYNFEEVFPTSINDVRFNWGAYDDIVSISIDFKYTKYTVKNLSSASQTPTQVAPQTTPVDNQPAQNNQLPQSPILQ